jgi:hypothetical protein
MRVRIEADSATPAEVMDLTTAFQRTRHLGLPAQGHPEGEKPTVTVAGAAMGWRSPAMDPNRARHTLDLFENLTQLRAVHDSMRPACVDTAPEGGDDDAMMAAGHRESAHHRLAPSEIGQHLHRDHPIQHAPDGFDAEQYLARLRGIDTTDLDPVQRQRLAVHEYLHQSAGD